MEVSQRRRVPWVVLAVALLVLVGAIVTALLVADEPPELVEEPTPTPPAPDEARTYVVAPGGSDDDPGTEDEPFATVERGLTALRAGDTLLLREGTYTENIRAVLEPGTEDRPIRVESYPDEQAVIEGLLWLHRPVHVVIDRIHVTWNDNNSSGAHMVRLIDGHDFELTNSRLWDTRSFAALLVASSGDRPGEPSGWRVADNCIHDTHPSNATNQDHLVYVNAGEGNGGVIEHNLLFNATNGQAVKIGGASEREPGTRGVTVRYNTMYNTSQNLLIAWDSADNLVYRNIFGWTRSAHVRGYQLADSSNTARENVAHPEASIVANDRDYGQISDLANVTDWPDFDHTDGCDGFRPRNPDVQAYGHLAEHVETSALLPQGRSGATRDAAGPRCAARPASDGAGSVRARCLARPCPLAGSAWRR